MNGQVSSIVFSRDKEAWINGQVSVRQVVLSSVETKGPG